MICPCCAFHIEKLTPELVEKHEGATFDCPNCEALLLIRDRRVVEFHPHLHKADSRWPSDGASAHSIGYEVKSRKARQDEQTVYSQFDASTGQAHFHANDRMYGPVRLSIEDYHTLCAALEGARREAAVKAAHEIKQQIDAAVSVIFNR